MTHAAPVKTAGPEAKPKCCCAGHDRGARAQPTGRAARPAGDAGDAPTRSLPGAHEHRPRTAPASPFGYTAAVQSPHADHASGKDVARDAGKDPPATPASGGATSSGSSKSLSVYLVSLPGSTRDPFADVTRANAIWAQCSLTINVAGGESWTSKVLDKLAPAGVLNEYSNPSSPTTEETELIAYRPGGNSAIHVYFVPAMSGNSRGESFWPAVAPTLPGAVVVSDSAASDTFAHELGHVVLNDGGHHPDPDNLMATGAIRHVGVDKLDATQCSKV